VTVPGAPVPRRRHRIASWLPHDAAERLSEGHPPGGRMTASIRSESRVLVDLGTLTDFLVGSGQQGPAIAAAERLAEALLAYAGNLSRVVPAEADAIRREALRVQAEVRLISGRLRAGPVRHAPSLRQRLEKLLVPEVTAIAV
jgi:hypothetical protein